MVSISNNYSLTILWMIQINSEKIIPHHVLPSEWFPRITKNKRQNYHSQILCPLFTILFTAYWRPNNRKSVFQGNKPGGFFILSSNLHGLWFINNCSLFSLVQVMFFSVGHPLPHSILSKIPAPTPFEHTIDYMSNDFFWFRFLYYLFLFWFMLSLSGPPPQPDPNPPPPRPPSTNAAPPSPPSANWNLQTWGDSSGFFCVSFFLCLYRLAINNCYPF